MRLGAATLSLCVLATLAGCGGGGGREGKWESAPAPLEWKSGARFGLVVFDVPMKDPVTADEPTCTFTAHFAEASEQGGLPLSDEEGACVVTTSTDLRGLSPDPAPVCAGQIRLEFADRTRRLTVCPESSFPTPTEIDCAMASAAGRAHVTSGPDETDGDRIGGLDVTLERRPAPVVTAPELLPSDSVQWPASGDLQIGWETVEEPLKGEAVELVLRALGSDAPMVRCVVADDGDATIPERLTTPYRGAEATVEIARIAQIRGDVDGFDLRATARTSDTFRLLPR